jgi:ABC-2 type transport system permease protein
MKREGIDMQGLIRDTFIITKNELIFTARNPFWIFFGLFQPVIYLLLFAPFLKGVAGAPGFPSQNAIQFFAPGLLILNALFNAAFAGFGLLDRLQSGFLERLRVTPISRLSLVLGLVLVTSTELVFQSLILIGVALFFGLSVNSIGTILVIVLLLLIGITMASISYALALIVKDGGVLAGVTNFFTLPLLLLSGTMLPTDFAPPIIQNLCKADPFKYAVDAARALMNGRLADTSVVIAFAVFAVLAALATAWFIKRMRESVA